MNLNWPRPPSGAHRLTEALRIKGYDAYEFHDRYCSIVTVGSFSSTGTPRRDGMIEINPEILAVIETFKAAPQTSRRLAQRLPRPQDA